MRHFPGGQGDVGFRGGEGDGVRLCQLLALVEDDVSKHTDQTVLSLGQFCQVQLNVVSLILHLQTNNIGYVRTDLNKIITYTLQQPCTSPTNK